jgi:RND family efflux transporter MFP subunit
MPTSFSATSKFFRSKWVLGTIAIIVLIAGFWFFTHRGKASYQFIPVTKGSIIETVSVTGNTTPMQSVSLGFQNSGTIAHVYYQLGNVVSAGSVIAQLNTANLSAALAQAQASLAAQEANLQGLQAGAQPEDIASSQAALQEAQQNLANMYASIGDISNDAYAKGNDAVRTELNPLFANAETDKPTLTFQTSDSQSASDAVSERVAASVALNAWEANLSSLGGSAATSTLSAAIPADLSYLQTIRTLLSSVSVALQGAVNLSASSLASDNAAVAQALSEVNTATTNLNTISQNISSQLSSVAQAQAQLALKKAGSTSQDIAAQQAEVQQAQASVAQAEANLQDVQIVAPITGTLTQQDAKVGQQASPGTPLVSIIGNSGFEVDAGVSETDVGKVTVGDPTTMTLDAFPGETFTGTVFYVAPAQTDAQGVITYLTKISFDKTSAALKSGLTANVNIQTSKKDDVLILPQYAILQNDSGTFVETLDNGVATTTPVTLGIQDQSGNVEILSGVTLGEKVINIGLKTQ